MTIDILRTISISVNIVCILITFSLMFLYFPKRKIYTKENSIYDALLISNLTSLGAELLFYMLAATTFTNYMTFVERLYFASNSLWMFFNTLYIFVIAYGTLFKRLDLKKKKIFTVFLIILILCCALFLPVTHIYKDNMIVGSIGPLYNFMFLACVGLTLLDIFIIIRKRKSIQKRKLIPLLLFILLILAELVTNILGFELLLITLPMTMVSFLMYHTIENPDIQIIEQLNMAKDSAEKANLAKTEFLSNMSHEIRTPLNAIVGFSECMVDSNDLNETKQFAKDIVDASNNLLEIVNGILDISKIEANKMEIIPKEYNPREVFNSLSTLAKTRIGEKPIEFKMFMANDLPGVLKGDVSKVKQIVLNILTNAVKYTDEGKIIFNVNCINRTDTNTCLLYISVKDTGRGIKKEHLDKLFTKFERLDEDKNTTTEGTGLGLAITKSLTEMMGGRISVQSTYGEGSTFRIYLEQEIISMDIPESVSEEIEIDYNIHNGKRILVVDDSKINLKVASQILKPYNFNIINAESGYEALELAENSTFDLILMDIMMPKMNGIETLNRLKQIPGFDVPVIALTADAIEGTDEKYKNAGFDDYLSKPIDRYILNKVLNKYLGGNNNE